MIRLKIAKQFSSLLCICIALALLCIGNNCPMAIASNHTDMTYKKIVEIFGDDFWKQFDLQSLSDISAISFAVSGNCAYQLMENGDLYQLDLQKMEYRLFCQLPALPTVDFSSEMQYSDLNDAVKAQIDGAVFQIIGDIRENLLYGYCPVSGRIGVIDETGIHWNGVQFDCADTNPTNAAYPEALSYAFVDENVLYAFVDQPSISDESCQGVLVSFDLQSGNCAYTELPETYLFCPYENDQLLLLVRDSQGEMHLDRFNISTFERDEVISVVPIVSDAECGDDWFSIASAISGLAYNDEDIFLATEDGLWLMEGTNHFSNVALEGSAWTTVNPYSQAWISCGGAYVFHNGKNYVVTDD